MDAAFGVGHALKDGEGAGFYPMGERAVLNQMTDTGEGAFAMVMVVPEGEVMMIVMVSVVTMPMGMGVLMVVRVGMPGSVGVGVFVGVGRECGGSRSKLRIKSGRRSGSWGEMGGGGEVDVEFGAGDVGFLGAGGVEVIALEVEATELFFELGEVDAQVEEGAEKHVAADAAQQVQIECLHESAGCAERALI
jgi:hypothetical protein